MYTLQALWTQAREGLDVTTLSREPQLRDPRDRARSAPASRSPGPPPRPLTDLGAPPLDWVALAGGMGVPAGRATTAEELTAALGRALAEPGPHLIEAVLGSVRMS